MASNFFEGLAQGITQGVQNKRLRDQMRLEDARERRREQIQQDQFQQRQNMQREQMDALERYRAGQQELQQKQLAIQTRKADLDFANGFMKAFDPKTPKSARRFLLGTMANHLGVDRKSQQFKDFDALVTGLEDEQLSALQGSIAAMLPDAQPGQIMDFAKTIMNGQMTLPQLTEAIGKTQVQKTREKIIEESIGGQDTSQTIGGGAMATGTANLGPPDPLAERKAEIEATKKRRDAFHKAGLMEDMRAEQQKLKDLESAGEFEPELRGAIKKEELSAEEALKLEKPVSPAITRILGIPGMKLTEGRARELGIDTAILDGKTLRDINTQKAAATSSIDQIDKLREIITPAAVGNVGRFVRGVDSFIDQAFAIPDVAGLDLSAFRKKTRGIIGENLPETSAVIQSRVVDLAYSMAQARDGGRLSDQDILRFREQLGESGSVPQFLAVLDDMKDRIRSQTSGNIEALTGVKPIDLMTAAELNSAIDEIEDVDMMRAVIKEQERRRGRKQK